MAMFDLSSSWMEGSHCELAARGYSRDGKKGKTQIEYGLLTDAPARPVAIRVFAGNTADPTAFIEAVEVVRTKFGLQRLTMVGDRGMITSARIDGASDDTGLSWITCLRAPDIAALAADDGPLQMSLFDTHDLAEITHPDYPGERLIACRNPALAELRARKRDDLLACHRSAPRQDHHPGRGRHPGRAGRASGSRSARSSTSTRWPNTSPSTSDHTSFTYQRNQARIDAEAALDGIYVIRTNVPADTLDAAGVVVAYKNLAGLERDFRNIKIDDLDLRPIHHYLTGRVGAHVLICMLAQYLIWHLRRAWAPLTYTDEHPPPATTPSPPPPAPTPPPPRPAPTPTPTATRPQLPRPARPPGHPDPQHHRLRRPPPRHPRHPHPHPTPRLRTHRRTHPTHPHVDTTTTPPNRRTRCCPYVTRGSPG